MVKKSKNYLTDETNKFSEITSFSPSNQFITPNSILLQENPSDDLIGSLSNAYENKRARQVSEWEKLQSRSFHKTA